MNPQEPWTAGKFNLSKIHRFCDVVMKGGVTSGIVYPPAICYLASKYVLRNIGGTSVGAIAAGLTAAAEFRRRSALTASPISEPEAGYIALSKVPAFLSQSEAMIALFAADPRAKDLLRIALAFVGTSSFWVKAVNVIAAIFKSWLYALVGLLVVALFTFGFYFANHGATWPTVYGLILGIALAILALLILIIRHCIVVLAENDFGWCHGFDPADAKKFQATLGDLPNHDVTSLRADQTPRLFDWLDALMAFIAGRDREKPLTFRDLRTASVPTWYKLPPWYEPPKPEDGIGFRVMTTCLTLGRPFSIPFDDDALAALGPGAADGKGLFFDPADMRKYFPEHIVAHMITCGEPVEYHMPGVKQLHAFPAADDLPVVVAVRMSMSFPVLFSAVRLYGLDVDAGGKKVVKPLWFSDGGLSSNFPLHFFDSALPRWPTFALDLLGGGTGNAAQDVFLESDDPIRASDVWSTLEQPKPLSRLLAFGSSILDAMRTWHDTTLGALPGSLSRTIGLCLPQDEGGVNLKMTQPQIENLAALGNQAGVVLDTKFASHADTDAWRLQRWYRYLATMDSGAGWLGEFQLGYAPFNSAQLCYSKMILANVYAPGAPQTYAGACVWPSSTVANSVDKQTQTVASSYSASVAKDVAAIAPRPAAELGLRPRNT
jgi:hypothetical protein